MNEILDFDKEEDIDLRKIKFHGKLAGKGWQYERVIANLTRTRIVIFFSALAMFGPVIFNYLFHDYFAMSLLIERIALSGILIVCGALFNKFRLVSLLLALLPLILVFILYLLYAPQFSLKIIGFNGALIVMVILGIYNHFKEKKLRKELLTELKNNPEIIEKTKKN